jgi:tellurite resistance protein TerC
MTAISLHHWIIFGIVIAAALAIDLLAFHGKGRATNLKSALVESAGWIALSLAFGTWIYFSMGSRAGLDFLAAYLVEKSLSLDNIFVFLIIFQAFRVPSESQHKVLFGGVLGALVLRAIFVIAGIELLNFFHSVTYIFGGFLVFIGLRMLFSSKRALHPERNWLVRVIQKVFPVTDHFEGDKFWLRKNNKWDATPLLLALVAVEAMDIVFAVDSVPAVLAITRDTFIAYASNAFAILGLRALYFALADIFPRFRFLHQGLAAILIFVGFKMGLGDRIAVSTPLSIVVIAGILTVSIMVSLAAPPKDSRRAPHQS